MNETEGTVIDETLDIRGEVCPFTFVKSKLAIEAMTEGKVLKVVVDYEPAIDNVPRSMTAEGHDVISIEKTGEVEWEIVVRKK